MSFWHWILAVLGVNNESGKWYAFWSGSGADLGYLGICGGLIGVARAHNCHEKGCWRPHRRVTVNGHKLCHKHAALPLSALHLPKVHEDHR